MAEINLFPDVGWENLALRELHDRRARDSLVRLTATPSLARQVAALSQAYPQLSGGVTTAAALAGLTPGSPQMTQLAAQELALGTPVERPAENPILTHVKGLVRNFFTLFDLAYKEAVVGTTSYVTGLFQGITDPGRSYGFSGGALAIAERLQRAGGIGGYLGEIMPGGRVGEPLRIGEGLLPPEEDIAG